MVGRCVEPLCLFAAGGNLALEENVSVLALLDRLTTRVHVAAIEAHSRTATQQTTQTQ